MKAGTLSESGRIRPHLTPLECGIIFGGIPAGAISRKGGLIWGIPVKIYPDLDPLPLPFEASPSVVPALSAISMEVIPSVSDGTLDITTLSSILYFSAGITKRLNFPWGSMSFRAAACTGALYHIELYVVCGDLPGLAAGVYHYNPGGPSLTRLRPGDYRGTLVAASGNEPSLTHAPAIILYTDVFWRNACKYQAREYRHSYWDSGTILANTLAIAAAHGLPAKLDFVHSSGITKGI